MSKIFFYVWLALFANPISVFSQSLKSPEQFLGYKLGEQFTFHYQILNYLNHVVENSDRVQLKSLGFSYEGREQVIMMISSKQNLMNLEEIRLNNLKRAKILPGNPNFEMPVIVWLSYNVHGNEAVSAEAAMQTIYQLVSASNAEQLKWLDQAVVIINPVLNPDGRDRYVTWYKQTMGTKPNADPNTREHNFQWASGRTNHYYFDMNRDWAWMTQKETQVRITEYNQWMPQIHVDFHEQGYNEPYYFAPAAEPIHPAVTPFQRSFQEVIGKNHATYFDKNAWLFFTRQRFDLFYPSYGDSWPIFNGSIGMTYEQGGINAGLQVITETGDTLTLAQRIEHHVTTGLSTIEISVNKKKDLLTNFSEYFKNSVENPDSDFKTYIVKKSSGNAAQSMLTLLENQGILYESAPEGKQVNGYSYFTNKKETYKTQKGDWLISSYQPKSKLLTVLFDPSPKLSDSLTYDITSWALPWVYGVDVLGLDQKMKGNPAEVSSIEMPKPNALAYIFSWDSFSNAQLLSKLYLSGLKLRMTEVPMVIDKQVYNQGSILILKADNKNTEFDYSSKVIELSKQFQIPVRAIESGYLESGVDLGSGDLKFLTTPKVALISGDAANASNVGELWYYFDQLLQYPIHLIDAESVSRIKLYEYDAILLPSGSYSDVFKDSEVAQLKEFVKNGGTLITLGNAAKWVSSVSDFGTISQKNLKNDESKPVLGNYADRERNYISSDSPGAYFKLKIDSTHPLGFGYSNGYFTLKTSEALFEPLKTGWNVALMSGNDHISGFIGSKLKDSMDSILILGNDSVGDGNIVYFTENIAFRAFLYHNHLALANAIFFVGQAH